MTKSEFERLAVLETKVQRVQDDVKDIIKNQEAFHNDISNKIELLTTSIDGNFVKDNQRLKDVESILAPFISFRENFWKWLIYTVLIAGIAILLFYAVHQQLGL